MRGGEERKSREEIRKEVRGGKEKIREGMETGGRVGRGRKEGRRMEGWKCFGTWRGWERRMRTFGKD